MRNHSHGSVLLQSLLVSVCFTLVEVWNHFLVVLLECLSQLGFLWRELLWCLPNDCQVSLSHRLNMVVQGCVCIVGTTTSTESAFSRCSCCCNVIGTLLFMIYNLFLLFVWNSSNLGRFDNLGLHPCDCTHRVASIIALGLSHCMLMMMPFITVELSIETSSPQLGRRPRPRQVVRTV